MTDKYLFLGFLVLTAIAVGIHKAWEAYLRWTWRKIAEEIEANRVFDANQRMRL